MARGQQRRTVNRGLVQPVNARPLPDISWQIEQASPTVVRLTPRWDPADLLIYHVPQLVRYSDGALPATCVNAGGFFDLTYAGGAPLGQTYTLGWQDPGIRSMSGAYLTPGQFFLGTPPGPIIALGLVTPTWASQVGYNTTFNLPMVGPSRVIMSPAGWGNVTTGDTAVAAVYDFNAQTLTVTWGFAPLTGDELVYDDLGLASYLAYGMTIGPVSIIVP